MNKRWIALLLAGMLTACAPISAQRGTQPEEEPMALVLLLDEQTDPIARQAAEVFAEDVAAISEQTLMLTPTIVEDAVEAYQAGQGDLVFVDAREDAGFSTELDLLATPLLYRDYSTFSMALNAERMLEVVNAGLQDKESQALAAFYTGSNLLMTVNRQISGQMNLSQLVGDLPEDIPFGAMLVEDTVIAPQMENFGLTVVTQPDSQLRLAAIASHETALAEFRLAEIAAFNLEGLEWNVIHFGHNISPLWLLLHEDAAGMMTDQQAAVLLEAVAYLFPEIDGKYLDQENAVLTQLKQQGMTVATSFPAFVYAANQQLIEAWDAQDQTRYLYQLIHGME